VGTKLKDIVQIDITRETARITRVGFGTPLILGEHFHFEDRVRSYNDPADMLDDGFELTDPHYLAALALMAQELSPTLFKIGRKLADVNEQQKITFTGTASAGTWTVTLDAVTSGAINWDDDAAALEIVLEAMANITSVTVTGTLAAGFTIEFDGADAATAFNTFTVDVSSLTGVTAAAVEVLQEGSAVETWAAALAAIIVADDDWYCLLITDNTDQTIEDMADAIEALTSLKIFIADSAEADIIAAPLTDIVSVLKAKSLDRTAVIYHTQAGTEYPAAGWAGGQLPADPGSITWKFKEIKLVTFDVLTTNAVTIMLGKNANFYEQVAGLNIVTSNAVVVGGEYIDVIRGVDWLGQRMAERIFVVLANAPKVPFTNQGIGLIEAEVRAQLEEGVTKGVLRPDTLVINVPDISEVSVVDKANREFNDITFSAELAGAIHKVKVVGKVTL
jgi:hypothetical protein